MPEYQQDSSIDMECREAAEQYLKVCQTLDDQSFWPIKAFTALNIFYWHLEESPKERDPRPEFINVFQKAAGFLMSARDSGVCGSYFPPMAANVGGTGQDVDENFEKKISGLFSDVWVDFSDEVYFDEAYEFTAERFLRNGVDAKVFFKDKVVLDAGCGSGKYSAALARLGAKQVIGVDIGQKGLAFAEAQKAKVSYGDRISYKVGSLLDIPVDDASVDAVWSNGVIHHTTDYEKCLSEFSRIIKPGGDLYLYVEGPEGLYELMCDTFIECHKEVPRSVFQNLLHSLGVNTGRIYWIMDCLYAPYERKKPEEVEALLEKWGFTQIQRMVRGLDIDNNEIVANGTPFASVKYGEGMLKYLAKRKSE